MARISPNQQKLLGEIAKQNADGVRPRVYGVDERSFDALLGKRLVTYLGGFAELTKLGSDALASCQL